MPVRHATIGQSMAADTDEDARAGDRLTDGADGADEQLRGIWARQIEMPRGQTEEAIVPLAARFSAIVDRIDSALGANEAQLAGGHAGAAELRRNEEKTKQVIEALRSIQESRNNLVEEIRGLVSFTEELRKMATAVDAI